MLFSETFFFFFLLYSMCAGRAASVFPDETCDNTFPPDVRLCLLFSAKYFPAFWISPKAIFFLINKKRFLY